MQYKLEKYSAHGSELVVIIDPDTISAVVYAADDSGAIQYHTLKADDRLNGGAVLPGFSVGIRDIFPPT